MQGMWVTPAVAHANERGQVMLMPTGLYMLGGGLAVLASVLLLSFLPAMARWKAPAREFSVMAIRPALHYLPRIVSLAVLSTLALAGLYGPADPIANPLPGYIWSLWWAGFTMLCLLLRNLWPLFNP